MNFSQGFTNVKDFGNYMRSSDEEKKKSRQAWEQKLLDPTGETDVASLTDVEKFELAQKSGIGKLMSTVGGIAKPTEFQFEKAKGRKKSSSSLSSYMLRSPGQFQEQLKTLLGA